MLQTRDKILVARLFGSQLFVEGVRGGYLSPIKSVRGVECGLLRQRMIDPTNRKILGAKSPSAENVFGSVTRDWAVRDWIEIQVRLDSRIDGHRSAARED